MKKVVAFVVIALGISFTTVAQEEKMKEDRMTKEIPSVIALEQTPGEFTQKTLTVPAGTYVFEITNNNVDHNVGFILVEKGKDISKPENHIQTAYVTQPVANGEKQASKPTTLAKGEYVYFCPLNPTATDNTLIVE